MFSPTNQDRNTEVTRKDGTYAIFSGLDSTTDRYHMQLRNVTTGSVVAEASWGIAGNHYRAGKSLFGDRMEKAGFPRQGF